MGESEIRGLRKSFTREEYVSSDIFAAEMKQIFSAHWCYVGRSDQLSLVGDRLVAQVGDESVLVVRNRQGELRAYFNVCQHRGSQLCDQSGSGHGGAITCPYHAWSYSLDGRLVGAIHHEKESFDRDAISLESVHVDIWQGLLFVNLSKHPIPLLEWLDEMYSKPRDLERFNLASLKSAHTSIDEVSANWKVLVENYSECLHCSVVHPELCETVPIYRTGRTTQDDRDDWGASLAAGKTAISFAQNEDLPLIPSMETLEDYSVFGAYVYPNMLIDVMPTCVAVSTYVPRSPSHTTVITDYLFPQSAINDGLTDLKPTIDFNELVNTQDFAVSERVQRGVSSHSFAQAYHTELEKYAHQFVKQYRKDTTSI